MNDRKTFDRGEILGLNYVSLYFSEFDKARTFYSTVFGQPDVDTGDGKITGWKTGSTWLTIFPARGGTKTDQNPCNCEFAIQVKTHEQVDELYAAFVAAGAKGSWKPEDTEMYEPMRFAAIDDPFGVRIDIYCPIEK